MLYQLSYSRSRTAGDHTTRELPSGRPGWTSSHTRDMVIHMKTTLHIDDSVMAQLKRESIRQGRTMSDLVETALRLLFRPRKDAPAPRELPTFRSGGALVDVADRNELYRATEDR